MSFKIKSNPTLSFRLSFHKSLFEFGSPISIVCQCTWMQSNHRRISESNAFDVNYSWQPTRPYVVRQSVLRLNRNQCRPVYRSNWWWVSCWPPDPCPDSSSNHRQCTNLRWIEFAENWNFIWKRCETNKCQSSGHQVVRTMLLNVVLDTSTFEMQLLDDIGSTLSVVVCWS